MMCLTQFISSMYVFMPILKLGYHYFISQYSVNVNETKPLKSHKRTEFVLKSCITDQHKLKLRVTLTKKKIHVL